MRRSIACLVVFFTLLVPSIAWAANYDEAVSGDISGDRLAPMPFVIATGTNSLSATSVSGDLEYFTITIPAGSQLRAIRVTAYAGIDQRAFLGVQRSPTFTEPPTGTNPANLLGYTHFGPSVEPIGNNVLDNAAVGAGSQGFSGMLGPGVYTFWSQQTGGNATSYTLAFDVGPTPAVPVPPVFAALLALGLGFVGIRRFRARA